MKGTYENGETLLYLVQFLAHWVGNAFQFGAKLNSNINTVLEMA